MSHCRACDHLLSDREASRTYKDSDEEVELCDPCFEEAFGYDALYPASPTELEVNELLKEKQIESNEG